VVSIAIKPIISIVRFESEIVATIKTMSESVLIEGGGRVRKGPRLMFVNGRSLTKRQFYYNIFLTHLYP
jgi:hypothetical protein